MIFKNILKFKSLKKNVNVQANFFRLHNLLDLYLSLSLSLSVKHI